MLWYIYQALLRFASPWLLPNLLILEKLVSKHGFVYCSWRREWQENMKKKSQLVSTNQEGSQPDQDDSLESMTWSRLRVLDSVEFINWTVTVSLYMLSSDSKSTMIEDFWPYNWHILYSSVVYINWGEEFKSPIISLLCGGGLSNCRN